MRQAHVAFALLVVTIVCLAVWYSVVPTQRQEAGFASTEGARVAEQRVSGLERRRARVEFFHRMLREPGTGRVPRNIRQIELEHARILAQRMKAKRGSVELFQWVAAGPMDVGGRTRALAVDVTDSNVILAGGVSGGVWKSTDGGETWAAKTSPEQHHGVTWIAQDTRPGHTNTWYYTTGEWLGTEQDRGSVALYYGAGLYKSTDGGESWRLVLDAGRFPGPDDFHSDFDFLSKVVVNPVTGSVFIASNGYGIYRSTDGGRSFRLVLGGRGHHFWSDIAVHEPTGRLVAAISRGRFAPALVPGVYQSDNDGDSWKLANRVDRVIPGFPSFPGRIVVSFTHSPDSNIVYVFSWTSSTGTTSDQARLHRLVLDSLGRWDALRRMHRDSLPDFGSPFGGIDFQLGYNIVVAVKPDDPYFVLLGATNLFRSANAFGTSASKSDWIGGYNRDPTSGMQFRGHHADQHVLVFDHRNPNRLWSGHDGGISLLEDVTDEVDLEMSWRDMDSSYVVTQYYTVAMGHEADDNRLIGGTQDNGTVYFRINASGVQSGTSVDVSGGDGGYAYLGKQFAYVSLPFGHVYRQGYMDGDPIRKISHRNRVDPGEATERLFVAPFVVDPENEEVMYYAAYESLWRTRMLSKVTRFTGWTRMVELPAGYLVSALSVSHSPAHVLYVGASNEGCCVLPLVFRVANAADSTVGAPEVFGVPTTPGAYVHGIAVNPASADELLVVVSNYGVPSIFHSSDGGLSFSDVEGNLADIGTLQGPSVRSATILPLEGEVIYMVATSTGLYATTELRGAATVWEPQGAATMGSIIVEAVVSRRSDGRVVAGTHGRGLFVTTPRAPVGVERAPATDTQAFLSQNYPNPFRQKTNIAYTLPQGGVVSISVFDVNGRLVTHVIDEVELLEGQHQAEFDAKGLAAGTYMYRLKVIQEEESVVTESRTMTVVR